MGQTKKELDEFEFVDKKSSQDEFVIYSDVDDIGRVFVSQKVLNRFHIQKPVYKLMLDTKEELYEISPQEAVYIIEHANNPYAPYKVIYQNFDFKNEIEDKVQQHKDKTAREIIATIDIYRDIENSDRAFVTIDVIRRFNLEAPKHKVLLGNKVVYEIETVQAINIINNSNNPYAPYKINYINIQFEKNRMKMEKDIIRPYTDQETNKSSNSQTKTPSIKRPRKRRPDERDEMYVAYLEGFYDSLFGYTEEEEKQSRLKETYQSSPVKKVDQKVVGSTDEEYVDYLKDYYHHMFNQDALEKIQPRNLIRRRARRPDESESGYQQYLAMFYLPKTRVEETKSISK